MWDPGCKFLHSLSPPHAAPADRVAKGPFYEVHITLGCAVKWQPAKSLIMFEEEGGESKKKEKEKKTPQVNNGARREESAGKGKCQGALIVFGRRKLSDTRSL